MANRVVDKTRLPSAFEAAFTRAQVEWALWRQEPANAKRKPSSIFKLRIKHLLEFDRSEPRKKADGLMAFSDEPPGGRGEHTLFSGYDALLLEIGLGLLDIGFKRKEVVLLLRDRRGPLRSQLGPILNQNFRSAARVTLLIDRDPVHASNAVRVALVLPRVEASPEQGSKSLEHYFCRGPQEIAKAIENFPSKHLVISDVSYSCHRLPSLLLQAPAARRGRSGT